MIDYFILAVTLLLLVIAYRVTKIDQRLKERFPTEKEVDYQWAMKDPMAHSEAHQKKESGSGKAKLEAFAEKKTLQVCRRTRRSGVNGVPWKLGGRCVVILKETGTVAEHLSIRRGPQLD